MNQHCHMVHNRHSLSLSLSLSLYISISLSLSLSLYISLSLSLRAIQIIHDLCMPTHNFVLSTQRLKSQSCPVTCSCKLTKQWERGSPQISTASPLRVYHILKQVASIRAASAIMILSTQWERRSPQISAASPLRVSDWSNRQTHRPNSHAVLPRQARAGE